MHEMSIAQSIVGIVLDQMKAHDLSQIESVKLRVGALRAVDRDSLGFSFELLTADSPMAGARLEVEEVPIQGRCAKCGHEFIMNHWMDDCPTCEAARVEIVTGKELDIVAIEGD
jgi:hydrogenase nickel incorporation protein HypA/HybF